MAVPGMAQTAGVVTGVAAAALCGYMLLAPSQRPTGQEKPRRLVTGIAQDESTQPCPDLEPEPKLELEPEPQP